jgi:hypothetical protein
MQSQVRIDFITEGVERELDILTRISDDYIDNLQESLFSLQPPDVFNRLASNAQLAMEQIEVKWQNMMAKVYTWVEPFAGIMAAAFADIVTGIKSANEAFKEMGRAMKQVIRDMIEMIIKVGILAGIVSLLTGVPFKDTFKAGMKMQVGIQDVPKMAEGGIVNRPTVALIGEKGPEAVVPLNKLRALHPPNISVNVAAPNLSGIEVALRDLAQVRPVAPVTIEPMQPMAAQMQQPQPPMQPVLRVGIGELYVELQRYGREHGLQLG